MMTEKYSKEYKGKSILVTGGVGSIGSEIVKSLLRFNLKVIRIYDNNETGLFDLESELNSHKIRSLVGDIRDKERLKRAIEGVDLVFHAAALKHVPLCEYNPFEAVKTNVLGTQNIIDVALDEEINKLITISTDKAVNPINVMGATKLLCEKLTISANSYKGKQKTAFSCVRFGNVLGSRGSVVPVFLKQIQNTGKITLTNPDMTRFVMPISQAVDLVLKSAPMAQGGEIFVFKMPVIKMGDLAEAMIKEFGPKYGYKPDNIAIEIIGKRPGEKDFEELITLDEAKNTYENQNMYVIYPLSNLSNLVATPKIPKTFTKVEIQQYSSHATKLLNKKEIRKLLIQAIGCDTTFDI